jgi:broad specificity phosphatase PhoE
VDIIFVRHGQSESNRDYIIEGSGNSPLTDAGIRQAVCVAERLRSENIAAVYSSHLLRAADTAGKIAEEKNLTVRIWRDLAEQHIGEAEGMGVRELIVQYPRMIMKMALGSGGPPFPSAEPTALFFDRIRRAIDDLVSFHARDTIVVVAHGGVISAAWSYLLEGECNLNWAFAIDNASVSRIRIENGMAQPLLFNAIDHLPRESLGKRVGHRIAQYILSSPRILVPVLWCSAKLLPAADWGRKRILADR